MRALVPAGSEARITRRALLGGFAVVGGALLTGCARSTGFAASKQPGGPLEGQLNIYSWGDYDDPGVLSAFHDKTGVTLQIDSYGSNEELVAKLGATRGTSGYDIVVPTGGYVPMMAKNGLLQKLDHSLLPNMKNIEKAYLDQSWDRGNTYTVCKNWGTTGFAYDTNVIKRTLTSWADFLDVAKNEASKNTAILDDPWEVCCIYFAANGIDPNTTDADALEACRTYLVSNLAPHVKAFNSSAAETGIQEETFALIHAYNGDVRLALLAGKEIPKNWKFVYPTPTANLWMDNWAIAKGAQNINAAYAFIDYILQPEAALKETDYIGYPTGITGVRDLAEKEKFDLPELVFPPDDVVKRLTPAIVNSASQKQVRILNEMMAKAGS